MPSKFLIVGTQRTGSQALFNALNLHPDVVCGGEWTQYVPWYAKVKVADRALKGDFADLIARRPKDQKRFAAAYGEHTQWLGFKILFRSSDKWIVHPRFAPGLLVDRPSGHLAWLRSQPQTHVIQLVRRNSMDWLKSKYLSRVTGSYTNTKYPDETRVTIPAGRALRAVMAKNWVDSQLATLSESNPYLRVYYEDFLADNRGVLGACLEFLGCDLTRLADDGQFVQRQSNGTVADYVRNYDQLAATLERRNLLTSSLCD